MSMVKNEFAGAISLLRVRIKTQTRNFIWFYIVAAVLLLGALAAFIIGVTQNSESVKHYNVTDWSATLFIGAIIGFIIIMLTYRSINAKLSVFPQTNNSRFVSTLLFDYIFALTVSLTALVMYLLYCCVVKIFSVFTGNLYFALRIDIGFIIAGFFVQLAYSFLVVAFIELVGTLLRKFTYYAAVVFTAACALAIGNLMAVIEYAPKVLAFLVKESSLVLFFLKAAGLWVVITAASLVINHFTVYHKSRSQTINKRVVAVCVGIAVAIVFLVPLGLILNATNEISYSMSEAVHEQMDDFYKSTDVIRIDVSHLPNGSRIDVKGENIDVTSMGVATVYSSNDLLARISGVEALEDLQGDTLVIWFFPPFYNINGVELMRFANPRVEAYMDGSSLVIDYSIDDAQVVLVPIWSLARQFDRFKDKDLFPEHTLFSSIGGNKSANIYVSVE